MSNKLPHWKYRRKFNINSSSNGTQTNYQLNLMVNRIDLSAGTVAYRIIYENTGSSGLNDKNTYSYDDFSSITDYVIQSGDYIEYDIFWTDVTNNISFDYFCSDGITNLRSSSAVDQNGLSMNPITDISSRCLNTWYSRKAALPVSHVGKTITQFNIAIDKSNLTSSSAWYSTAYIKNIRITNGSGTTRKLILLGTESSTTTTSSIYGIESHLSVNDFTNISTTATLSMCFHPNGDIYANHNTASGCIYKQTGGTGSFNVVTGTSSKDWSGITVSKITGNVYATLYGGGVYVQLNGSTGFSLLTGSVTKNWKGIAVSPITGAIYAAVVGGKIWKKDSETSGTFYELTTQSTNQNWGEISIDPDGNVYAGVQPGYQYKQTGETGNFVSLTASPSCTWSGQYTAPNGNIYAINETLPGLYIKPRGTDLFTIVDCPQFVGLGTNSVGLCITNTWDFYIGTTTTIYKSKINGNRNSIKYFTPYPPTESSNIANVSSTKVLSDFSDLRFTSSDGVTLLNHWIEHYDVSSKFAIVWIKFPSIPYTGTKTIDGLYTVRTFTKSGVFNVNVAGNISYLVVAGGGGSGGDTANQSWEGGGGGGQVVPGTLAVSPSVLNITVGSGGTSQVGNTSLAGSSGGNSYLQSITAIGGYGGGQISGIFNRGKGGASGSGFIGGNPYTSSGYNWSGGGGAGNAQNGFSPASKSIGGTGGIGTPSTITGITVYYGGGGAGGSDYTIGTPGLGTCGGGGNGACTGTSPTNGADGIVIIRYLTSDALEKTNYSQVDFYIYYGNSQATSTSSIDNTMDTGLRYWYFSSAAGPGVNGQPGPTRAIDPITSSSSYKGTDIDLSINHSWTSPAKIIINPANSWENQNPAQIIWYGWIKNRGTGTHIIYCSADDGQELSMNDSNTIIINDWTDQAEIEKNYTRSITSPVRVKYQYYANNVAAEVARLGWTPADGSGKAVPIPSTYLRCSKYVTSPPSFQSFDREESLFSLALLIF